MRIALRHRYLLVSEPRLNVEQTGARLDQPRRAGVPQDVRRIRSVVGEAEGRSRCQGSGTPLLLDDSFAVKHVQAAADNHRNTQPCGGFRKISKDDEPENRGAHQLYILKGC